MSERMPEMTKTARCFLCLVMAALMSATAVHAEEIQSPCIFVQELMGNPVVAEEFRGLLASTNKPPRFFGDPLDQWDSASGRLNDEIEYGSPGVDVVSLGCINCHNGSLAKTTEVRISAGNGSRQGSLGSSHPIGMPYGNYQNNPAFKFTESMGQNMHFIEGRVGCVTCHDLFNKEKMHLVMSNESDRLCMTCHSK